MAITLAELVYSELIGLVQRTRVSYPACFNKIRLTENMVDKRESYTKEDLLASGRGELFGAKGPQLPAPNMLMMDRVVKMTETGGNFDKGYVEAELDINPDLWFFGCHFIGDPVMPGCLGLDAMWQLVGFYLGWLGGGGKGRALGVGEEDSGTIEDVYEPYLVKNGFLNRTPKGRVATALAIEHFKQ